MIAVDTNLLVYAHRKEVAQYATAQPLLHGLAEGSVSWAVPWQCLHEFFGVVTGRRIYAKPTPRAQALSQIEAWLSSPSLVVLRETEQHWNTLKLLIDQGQVDGPMVHDARIAALCLQHGVHELWSADRDFRRFPQLRVRNPLVAS